MIAHLVPRLISAASSCSQADNDPHPEATDLAFSLR
jgi:hypothetical protein